MTITTRRRFEFGALFGAVVVTLLLGSVDANGQKATERFIPIGQSPGISGKYSSIGSLTGVNPRARTITIADAAGPRTVLVTDTTRIWLDRSKLKLSNVSGKFTDFVKGRRVEVKYQVPGNREVAEWVKVEITPP
jgi:hypothetical protein